MLSPQKALEHWPIEAPIFPAPDAGLINETFVVGSPPQAILQWVNPIFDPAIHGDLAALTDHLAAQGLTTPRLLPTRTGARVHLDTRGCWRLWSFIPGRTIHKVHSPHLAHAAGVLTGRFHAALWGWEHRFEGPSRNVHDTPTRMADLQAALEAADGHPLAGPARELGTSILEDWGRWEGNMEMPLRVCHGDLKISNLRFAEGDDAGVCLIDLDTVGPMTLTNEMGDAWRSWCNPVGENDPDGTRFDLEVFEASARGWLSTGPKLDPEERDSLVPGIERICLELAARFCTDAVQNSYFKEDRDAHPQPGAHNLLRARGQFRLASCAREARATCLSILRSA